MNEVEHLSRKYDHHSAIAERQEVNNYNWIDIAIQ